MTSAAPSENSPQAIYGTLITDGQRIDDGVLAVDGDRISYAGPAASFSPPEGAQKTVLSAGSFIFPGLIDLHTHGAAGGDFPGGQEDSARKAIDFLHSHGTTTLLASMVTASEADLLRGIELYVRLSEEGLIAGIHLEGPFLSEARCGAQDPAYLLAPDLELTERLIDAGQGKIVTMTYAPELEGAAALIELLTSHGITPSLGHTDSDAATAAASLAQAREGLAATGFDGHPGRPTITHLFNGMPPMHHRSPGPVAACLRFARAGKAAVELVADNTHLDPQTVLTVFELLGAENILLVSDSMAATGLSDGSYKLGPAAVTVNGGIATLDATGSIAGGTSTLLQVVLRTAAAGVALESAVFSATAAPARVLGLSDEVGGLRRGLRADAVVVSPEGELQSVMRAGKWLKISD
ncbi:N-acetylglucosamine-6-phosphate deacetylase [Psychromicrobium sp. YIM B11713]|uniref:N-acetylglucosamine-6-phosphate deacetylase n=1 Tax=Psychromicrobium sp. YIM B11713 TaxID=3145233 RepID=UPI00374E9CF4